MIFHNKPPADIWKKYVNSYIYFKGYQPEHSIERVVPDGHMYLVMELDNRTRHTYEESEGKLQIKHSFKGVWLSGLQKEFISISAHPNSEMFVIQFKPGGAYPFLPKSLIDYKDQVLPGEQIFGSKIEHFRNSVLNGKAIKDKVKVAEDWLSSLMDSSKVLDESVTNLIDYINNKSDLSNENISQYLETEKYSKKHFIDLFKKQVGVTPKYFQRIKRFNELIGMIHQKQKIEWTSVAHLCGFYDQSHLIKEFVKFSGYKPSEFLDKEHHAQYLNFFPID